jgi:N-acetylglucosamine-6-sulfatase
MYEYFWEWNFPHTPTQFAIRTDRHKLIEYHGIWDTDELFDLQADPAEQTNLIDDPKNRSLVRELRQRLHRIRAESGGAVLPLGTKQGPGMNRRSKAGSEGADFPANILAD